MRTNKNFRYILFVFTLLHYIVSLGQEQKLLTDGEIAYNKYQKAKSLYKQGKYSEAEYELRRIGVIGVVLKDSWLKEIEPFKKNLVSCIELEKQLNPSDSTALLNIYGINPDDPTAQEYVKRDQEKKDKIKIIPNSSNNKKDQFIEQKNIFDDSIKKIELVLQNVIEKYQTDSMIFSNTINDANRKIEEANRKIEDVNREIEDANKKIQRYQKILNAFYWYNDSIALASKQDENKKMIYYFINKEGSEINNLKEWDNAEPFDATFVGYAKVKKKDTEYLIDTFDNREKYGNREEYGKPNNGVTALDLSGNNYHAQTDNLTGQVKDPLSNIFPSNKHDITGKIKILNLHNTQIDGFYPDDTTEFHSLEYLDLSDNYLSMSSSLEGLKDLPSLKYLILRNSRINKLTAGFTKLNNLTYLDISRNKIDATNLRYIIEELIKNRIGKKLTLLIDEKQEEYIESIKDKMEKAEWKIIIVPEKIN